MSDISMMEENACNCKFCNKKPQLKIMSNVLSMEEYYYIACPDDNCKSDIITEMHDICDKNALMDCINEWNQLNKEEESTMKLTGEVILDEQTMSNIKEQVRKDVMKDIEIDGLYIDEVNRFLSNIGSIRQFSNIFEENIEEFLEKHKDDEYHFGDEKIITKLQTCLNILKM